MLKCHHVTLLHPNLLLCLNVKVLGVLSRRVLRVMLPIQSTYYACSGFVAT